MNGKLCILLIFCCICCWSPDTMAQEWNFDYDKHLAENQPELPSIGYLVGVLATMAAAIYGLVFVLKKIMVPGARASRKRQMLLEESLYLGNKTFLHAVRVGDQLMVVGVSPHNIQTLTQLPVTESEPVSVGEQNEEQGKTNNFSQILQGLMAAKK